MAYMWYPHGLPLAAPPYILTDAQQAELDEQNRSSYYSGALQQRNAHQYASLHGQPLAAVGPSSRWPSPIPSSGIHTPWNVSWDPAWKNSAGYFPDHSSQRGPMGTGYGIAHGAAPLTTYNKNLEADTDGRSPMNLAHERWNFSDGAYPLSYEAPDDRLTTFEDNTRLLPNNRATQVDLDELDKERNRDSSFSHPPIDFSRRQIRLVRVLRTKPGTPIRCKFALAMVDDDSIRYTALSYTWGGASKNSDIAKIILHKQDFWVRQNLWCFLRQVRDDPALRADWYWIDALCIDQAENGLNSHREKNHQVNMMNLIYSNADLVMVWLGEPEPEEHAALDALQSCNGAEKSEHRGKIIREGLGYLGSSSYWSRLWIIQELVLANEVIFRSGDYELAWDDVYRLRSETNQQLYWRVQDLGWAMTNILDLRHNWSRGEALDPITAVRDFRAQKCSDSRDKIYGLLNLMKEKPCRADYTQSSTDLFVKVFLWAFERNLLSFPSIYFDVQAKRWLCHAGPYSACTTLKLCSDTLGLTASSVRQALVQLARGLEDDWPLQHCMSYECTVDWEK